MISLCVDLVKKLLFVGKELETLQQSPLKEGRISISVYAEEEINVEFLISYAMHGCSWRPSYDIRVESATDSLELTYHGVISGLQEDWENIELTLSTTKQTLVGECPELPTAILTLKPGTKPAPKRFKKRKIPTSNSSTSLKKKQMQIIDYLVAIPSSPDLSSAHFPIEESASAQSVTEDFQTSISMRMPELVSLKCATKEHRIPITKLLLAASYTHISVPKLR